MSPWRTAFSISSDCVLLLLGPEATSVDCWEQIVLRTLYEKQWQQNCRMSRATFLGLHRADSVALGAGHKYKGAQECGEVAGSCCLEASNL